MPLAKIMLYLCYSYNFSLIKIVELTTKQSTGSTKRFHERFQFISAFSLAWFTKLHEMLAMYLDLDAENQQTFTLLSKQ